MALSVKREDVKQVPWFSPAEWHNVYRQIYSNDAAEQAEAYEVLLAWKARIPKLPVGVDCTLSILQVCLRDREWTSKIDSGELPMYYENDLSLMYSTTIMRFLNHVSNVGLTRETSLFKIAKQLNIPKWIVNLRHEAAHGHELPSIGVLRIAINILLEWLHNEYWAAEARAMEEYYTNEEAAEEVSSEEEGFDEMQAFANVIEVWSAVTLYIDADQELVSNLPDEQLREVLQDLRTYMLSKYNGNKTRSIGTREYEYIIISKKTIKLEKEYNLKAARALLLSDISEHLTENESSNTAIRRKGGMICDVLCENAAFLPNSEIMAIFQQTGQKTENNGLKGKILPPRMLQFWEDIIFLLHRKGMLETLVFKLLDIVDQEQESEERRACAALWISSIVYSFVQLDIAQDISRVAEYALCKLDTKTVSQYVRERLRKKYPYLRNIMWLDISSTMPHFLMDMNFLSRLLLRANEFSGKLIEPVLKLLVPRIDVETGQHLKHLLKSYTSLHVPVHNDENSDKIYTVEDFPRDSTEDEEEIRTRRNTRKGTAAHLLADQAIRNLDWKPALVDQWTHRWIESPIGLLPWQMDSLKNLEPLDVKTPKHAVSVLDSRITAGMINRKNLRMQSCIQWNDVLRRKRGILRKRERPATFSKAIMDRIIAESTKRTTHDA